jgi:hypothetical protein
MDAGEDEVGAVDAFALEALHPVADPGQQLTLVPSVWD